MMPAHSKRPAAMTPFFRERTGSLILVVEKIDEDQHLAYQKRCHRMEHRRQRRGRRRRNYFLCRSSRERLSGNQETPDDGTDSFDQPITGKGVFPGDNVEVVARNQNGDESRAEQQRS
jgi:hypothetical protein